MAEYEKGTPPRVKGAQLKKARDLMVISPAEIGLKIGVDEVLINAWEEDKATPNLRELEALGEIYARDIDYFLKDTPPPPSDIKLRGVEGKTLDYLPLEVKKVIAVFDELCRIGKEIEELLGIQKEVKIKKVDRGKSPGIAADDLRRKLGLDLRPVKNLRSILENEGIRVFELPVPDNGFSGFSFWHSEYGPCILINAKDVRGRKNFTLAHELWHLLIGSDPSICLIPLSFVSITRGVEYNANQFAVAFLLPKEGVFNYSKDKLPSKEPEVKVVRKIASYWQVSVQALGYRLEELNLIKTGHTDKLVFPKPFPRTPRKPLERRRLGDSFVNNTYKAYREGLISLSKAAHALQIPIRKVLEHSEIGSD